MLLVKRAWGLGKDFFLDQSTRGRALFLLGASIIFELLVVAVYVFINKWSNSFYTSLQNLDKEAFLHSMQIFAMVLLFAIIVFVAQYVVKARLVLSWRQYMTEKYLSKWADSKAYYGLHLLHQTNDNPDQRISEDVSSFTSLTISLSFGILNSIVTLCSFTAILWSLSGVLKFTISGQEVSIYGHLVWVALVYSIIVTLVTYKIGRRLADVDYLQEKKEANFRFAMMRFRENAESVALYRGEKYEQNIFKNAFTKIVENTLTIINISKNLSIWATFRVNIANVIPILVSAPRLFAKEIQFGDVMQIRGAFDQVLDALSFLASSFGTIASYKAVIERLTEFNHSIDQWRSVQSDNKIRISESKSDNLVLDNLTIRTPNEAAMFNLSYKMKPGNSYLITGKNGAGKSTLIKALGGIWVFGEGDIIFPENKSRFFIPQNTYMPVGTLKDVIVYPSCELDSVENITELMKEANIAHLIERLDNHENWSISLSLGEQQKIAILRAIIHKADILIMDESVSGVTEEDQERLYKLIKRKLPESIIVSVGHNSNLKKFHTEEIKL